MSYARFGCDDSDVYVFLHVSGFLYCCGCILQEREWIEDETRPVIGGDFGCVGEIVQTEFADTASMIAHLKAHRAAGHTVSQDTIDDLLADAEENDAWIATGEER